MDGGHFIRFHDKNAVFKFIRLSVDGRPIRRKNCVFKFIRLSMDVALVLKLYVSCNLLCYIFPVAEFLSVILRFHKHLSHLVLELQLIVEKLYKQLEERLIFHI